MIGYAQHAESLVHRQRSNKNGVASQVCHHRYSQPTLHMHSCVLRLCLVDGPRGLCAITMPLAQGLGLFLPAPSASLVPDQTLELI